MARKSSGAGGLVVVGFLAVIVAMCRGGGGSTPDHAVSRASPQSAAATQAQLLPQPIAEPQEVRYVSARSLNQRSAPNGGVVGNLAGGERVVLYERRGEWARVSPEGAPARWVSSRLLCSGPGCYSASAGGSRARPAVSNPRPARSNYGGSECPCSGSRVCIGPRGGRYCITSGGNKRYGV